ncbi:MAG TPA: NAD(P)H-dependent oxidoreductase [Rhizomicrobium sp.]|jgi:multimeric flavodoxin WrbA|nr:NAD(P)H-dependent oxidoreductase [Rhizomicrobium sp.]
MPSTSGDRPPAGLDPHAPHVSRHPASSVEAQTQRPLRVLLIAASQRRLHSCPGMDSKARFFAQRMAARLPAGWQIDVEDIGNEHGKPRIQPCNGCVSSAAPLCVWPCNCYGPKSETQPDLMWDRDLYGRLARADAWAFIGPMNWYGPTTGLKLMFDRLVCMSGGNPRPDLIDKKDTLKAQALERSALWRELSKNHLEGRTAAFFCYGDEGGPDIGADGRPKLIREAHKPWFDPEQEPFKGEKAHLSYQSLVWQCRYSGIEVPDALWSCATIGNGELYADDQASDLPKAQEALARFDDWVAAFALHVEAKGPMPDIAEDERAAQTTTNTDKQVV